MSDVRWGILGCGAVTEVKSGPALQKAARSTVTAVMRRNGALAADYAARHGIARWYDDADALIADPDVDAVYVATPPDSHMDYAVRALNAGKPVLCEKPMALDTGECMAMSDAAQQAGRTLVIAYYRRALPRFEKMRALIQSGAIGDPRAVEVRHFLPASARSEQAWKLDPAVGGGGFFTDVQTHTIDWLDHVFGPPQSVCGTKRRQAGDYPAEDLVAYTIGYETVVASGLCVYSADRHAETVRVIGSAGMVEMGFFRPSPVLLTSEKGEEWFAIDDPPHVHQPFVERVIACLLDGAENPCPPESAMRTNAVLETLYR